MRWSRHFPRKGAGKYCRRWALGDGSDFLPALDFRLPLVGHPALHAPSVAAGDGSFFHTHARARDNGAVGIAERSPAPEVAADPERATPQAAGGQSSLADLVLGLQRSAGNGAVGQRTKG